MDCFKRDRVELCGFSEAKVFIRYESLKGKLYLGLILESRHCFVVEIFVMLYRNLIGVGKCVARLDVSLAYKIRY